MAGDTCSGQISGYFEYEIEKILGKKTDPVLPNHEEALRRICDGYLASVASANSHPNPFGFLDLMALIAYFGELAYGDENMLEANESEIDRSEKNRRRFCSFMGKNMSCNGHNYDGLAGEIYKQVRNGLAHCMMLFPKEDGCPQITITHDLSFRAKKIAPGKRKIQLKELRNGDKVKVLCAEDLIEDMKTAINALFDDPAERERLVRFSRTHLPIVGTSCIA